MFSVALSFLLGLLSGVVLLALLLLALLITFYGDRSASAASDQSVSEDDQLTMRTRIPPELKAFMRSGPDASGSDWERCGALSLLLHFLFQEHKDTRQFRRWLYKKLQLELNDVTARSSAAGRIVQGIQIRDLEAGTNSPLLSRIRVESFQLAQDDPDFFEQLVLLADVDYRGGFQMSVDALMAFGKFAKLSVKLLHLNGRGRFTIRRQPFAHWSFSFVEAPQMELKIDSQFQGHQLPRHLIPLIGSAFRKMVQLKHVWPNYKLRFRPFFHNPLFSPSPNIAAFDHIELADTGLEVTVLSSSRLNIAALMGQTGAMPDRDKLYCKVMIEKRPYSVYKRQSSNTAKNDASKSGVTPSAGKFREAAHMLSVLLAFSRKGVEPLGLTFETKDPAGKEVCVARVQPDSNAAKCGFRVGDILVAVNNIPVRNERQATRLLTGTAGDLLVLVERELDHDEDEDDFEKPQINDADPTKTDGTLNDDLATPTSPTMILPRDDDSTLFQMALPLPEGSPIEYQARDESGEEGEEDVDAEPPIAKYKSGPEDGVELMVLPRRHRSGSAERPVPDRPSSLLNTLSPSIPESKRRKKKMKLLRRKRSDSLRHIGSIKRHRKLRRSRSETELHRLRIPEVRVESVEKDDTISNKLPGDNSSTTTTATDVPEGADKTDAARHQTVSRREKLHAKANEMAQRWSKSRLNEFIWNRRKPAELAIEAHDGMEVMEMEQEHQQHNQQQQLLEKPKQRKGMGRKKSPSPSTGAKPNTSAAIASPSTPSKASPDSISTSPKCTKTVRMTKDPIWGQSLHFGLRKESLYLNVLLYATNKDEERGDDDALLGWTSIYVPRIVEDCMLTLSNCHRERFHLKGPKESEASVVAEFEELSRHNGFDARLCFGDLLLGFRFFPNGLPGNIGPTHRPELSKSATATSLDGEVAQQPSAGSAQTPSPGLPEHQWTPLKHKQGFHFLCGVCGGKIWLKWASQCTRCHLVCHNKCMDRCRMERECRPVSSATDATAFNFNDDAAFEELDTSELVSMSSAADTMTTSTTVDGERNGTSTTDDGQPQQVPTTPSSSANPTTTTGCRRRRIAEKLQTLKNVAQGYSRTRKGAAQQPTTKGSEEGGGSATPESPRSPLLAEDQQPRPMVTIAEVLERELLDGLEGFGSSPDATSLGDLQFEPGNAYNPQVVEQAKNRGQHLFEWCDQVDERRRLINAQIDRVQAVIEQVTRQRRALTNKSGEAFERSEDRLQALAFIMMLYCYALTDCNDKEEAATRKAKASTIAASSADESGKSGTETQPSETGH